MFGALLAALLLSVAASAQETGRPIASVEGSVTDRLTGKPMAGALVSFGPASPQSGTRRTSAVTDANGKFIVNGIIPGSYRVVASGEKFMPQGDPVLIDVALGQNLKDVRLQLVSKATINGRVVDGSGKPIPGVILRAVTSGRENGIVSLMPCLGSKNADIPSNNNGEYHLFVRPGEYFVAACARSDFTNRPEPSGLVTGFYPGVVDPVDARTIRVGTEEDFNAGDFRLTPTELYSVRLRIPSSAGFNREKEQLQIMRRSPNGMETIQLLFSDPFRQNGGVLKKVGEDTYITPGLPPGNYEIDEQLAAYSSGPFQSGHASVRILNRDIDAGTLDMRPSVAISGTVRFDTGSLVQDFSKVFIRFWPVDGPQFGITSMNVAADGALIPFGASSGGGQVRSGGSYRIEALSLPADDYIGSIRSGTRTISGNIVTFNESAPAPVEVTIASPGGIAEGTVHDARNQPAAGSVVVLIPAPDLRNDTSRFKSAAADQNGRFSIHGIAPGDYNVLAWKSVDRDAWLDAEFLARYLSSGVKITIQAGAATGATVGVIPDVK